MASQPFRNLRVPASSISKSLPSTQSHLALFLTNLRLLDLDLRHDWPDITAVTFSTKDAQQNQKKRIQCVEWALYQLFFLWDGEETRNKLLPFFPPLEPLQSINLRSALFRCLDQAKKRGVLGRDTVLRKTMLDECKGERLEEVLSVFSTAVLKKVVLEERSHYGQPVAMQLSTENFSYMGERTVLSALNLAHRGVMSTELHRKQEVKAKLKDFTELLDLKERQIVRRKEQLKESVSARVEQDFITTEESGRLLAKLQKNWSGNNEWLQTILHGDGRFEKHGILAQSFDEVWKNVMINSATEVDDGKTRGLLDQLDARIKQQKHRLEKWRSFRESFSKGTDAGKTPSRTSPALQRSKRGIDLKFSGHETLQIHQKTCVATEATTQAPAKEYSHMLAKMEQDLAQVGGVVGNDETRSPYKYRDLLKADNSQSADELDDIEVSPRAPTSPPTPPKAVVDEDDGWSSTSSDEQSEARVTPTPVIRSKSIAQSRSSSNESSAQSPSLKRDSPSRDSIEKRRPIDGIEPQQSVGRASISTMPPPTKPIAPLAAPLQPLDSDSEAMADEILSSMAIASPSPVKPKLRHTLSLADRTRMSMVRASSSDFDDLPDLSHVKPKTSPSPPNPIIRVSEQADPHADLISRTRQSMSGFAAAQKKAEIDKRRSVKAAAKKARESGYFPPPFSIGAEEEEEEGSEGWEKVDRVGLIEGNVDADYDSVFKSRPKIALSPAVSPAKWDVADEELEDFEEESSPLRRPGR